MHEPGFEALGMVGAEPATDTALDPDRERYPKEAAGHEAQLGGMVDQLIHRQGGEVDEHDLDDGPHAFAAAPVAIPITVASLMGVSSIRASPNSSARPFVAPKGPP